MPSMVVVVINESLDSAIERGPVFLWLDVNILVFYRFPKSFNPNVVFGPAAAVHALASWLLVFVILALGNKENLPEIGMGELGAFPVTMLIVAIGMSLGATTGYAINPARDLAPRIAHAVLPIKGKGGNGWDYSWIPVAGPICGGLLAALTYMLIY